MSEKRDYSPEDEEPKRKKYLKKAKSDEEYGKKFDVREFYKLDPYDKLIEDRRIEPENNYKSVLF